MLPNQPHWLSPDDEQRISGRDERRMPTTLLFDASGVRGG